MVATTVTFSVISCTNVVAVFYSVVVVALIFILLLRLLFLRMP